MQINDQVKIYSNQINPNPYLYSIARSSFLFSFYLVSYSGIKSRFEHVLELGNIYESEVCLSTINFNEDKPPTGILSLPVAKDRKALRYSLLNSYKIYQKYFIIYV